MKHPLTLLSYALSLTAFGLTFFEYQSGTEGFDLRIVSASIALVAFFCFVPEFFRFTGPLHLAAFVVSILSMGAAVDPWMYHPPFLTLALFSVFMASHKEMLFRSVFSETDGNWLLFVLVPASIGLYIYGNLTTPAGWPGWAFPSPIIGFNLFIVFRSSVYGREMLKLTHSGKFIHESGKTAPEFSLPDHEGKTVSLSEFRGKRDILLMFVRNAWCPSCHIMLRTYNRNKEKFQEKNILLLAIGPNSAEVNRQMAIDLGIDYKILSDQELKTALAYRVLIPTEKGSKEGPEGTALPASFLIDKQGVIRYTSQPDKIGQFLDPATIFPILQNLN